MVHIEASHDIDAAPSTVWKLLADARGWQRWSPMDETTLEREGSPDPDGVGAIRRFRTGSIVSREEVIVSAAPRHFAYRLLSGLPLLDYRADVTLDPTSGGTRVTWTAEFRPRYPGTGWLYGFMIKRFLRTFLPALASAAEEAETQRSGAPIGARKAA